MKNDANEYVVWSKPYWTWTFLIYGLFLWLFHDLIIVFASFLTVVNGFFSKNYFGEKKNSKLKISDFLETLFFYLEKRKLLKS